VHGQEGVVISEGIFSGAAKPLPSFTPAADVALTMAQLTTFLRNPVKAFFRERFGVAFEDETLEDFDEESFKVDGLQAYALLKELLTQCPATLAASQVESVAKQLLCEVQQAGRLPLKAFGDRAQQTFEAILSTMLRSWALEQSKYVEFSARHPLNFEHQGLVVDDWLLNLLKSEQSSSDASFSAESVVVRIEFDAGKLRGKDEKQVPTVRAHKLLSCWVSSLVSAACGVQVRTVLIGQDAVVRVEPMPGDFATQTLATLLEVWHEGMNRPLPLPPKTALALLEGKDAVAPYEGGQYITGEVLDMCLAREFPDYASLVTNGLIQKAHEIYQPLLQWKESYVSIEPHSEASATQDDEDSTQQSGVAA
jgi:exodeoxyribonuclease V gamma subunit